MSKRVKIVADVNSIDEFENLKPTIMAKLKDIYPDIKNENIILQPKVKLGERMVDVEKSQIQQNNMGDVYAKYLAEHYPELDKEMFYGLDDEISRKLVITEDQFLGQQYSVLWMKGANLLSFEDFDFSFEQHSGMIRVKSTPENQGGKSNFIRLIKIMLFGVYYYNDERTNLEDLLNKHSNATYGKIEGLIFSKGKYYFIERTLTKKKTVTQEFNFYLSDKDGNKIENLTKKGQNSLPVDIVGTVKDFDFVSVMDKNNTEKLLFAKPTAKKLLFLNYFGLSLLLEKYDICKKLYDEWYQSSKLIQYKNTDFDAQISEKQELIESTLESVNMLSINIELINREINEVDSQISKQQNLLIGVPQLLVGVNIDDLNSKRLQLVEDINILNTKITDLQYAVATKLSTIEYKDKAEVKSILASYSDKIKEIKPDQSILEEIDTLQYMLKSYQLPLELQTNKVKAQDEVDKLRREWNHLSEDLKALNEDKFYVCVHCGQSNEEDVEGKKLELKEKMSNIEVEGKQKKVLLTQLEEDSFKLESEYKKNMEAQIQKLQKDMMASITSANKVLMLEQKALNAVLSTFSEVDNLNLQIDNLSSNLNNLHDKVNTIDDTILLYSKYDKDLEANNVITERIGALKVDYKELQTDLVNETVKLTESNNSVNKLKEDIKSIEEIRASIEDELVINNLFKTYLSIHDKKGNSITQYVLNGVIEELNNDLQSVLMDVDYMPFIEMDGDSIELNFLRDGKKFKLVHGSGYEKTLACITIHYILCKKSDIPKSNIINFDEAFDSVSKLNLNSVFTKVHQMQDVFSNIIVITHNPEIGEWVEEEIEIKKINNISTIIV